MYIYYVSYSNVTIKIVFEIKYDNVLLVNISTKNLYQPNNNHEKRIYHKWGGQSLLLLVRGL